MVPSNLQTSVEAKSRCAKSYTTYPRANKIKPVRLVVNQKVLAGRSQTVVPVGAWVESARNRWDESMEKQAFISAFQVEVELKKQQKKKQENLRRFQGEVKHRVKQWARLQKNQQLQKSYETAEKEGLMVKQSSEAAKYLTPKRNICVYRSSTEPTMCSSGSCWVYAEHLGDSIEEAAEGEGDDIRCELFQQHAKTLSKAIKQVRHRLAACKTVQEGEAWPELPGGIWRVSPTRDNPVSRRCSPIHINDGNEDEVFLKGYHDLSAELQHQMPTYSQGSHAVVQGEFRKVCKKLIKEPYPTGPFPAFSTNYQASFLLRPSVEQEENKKQRQNQYVMYRRLFMDIEREQVKELHRQKEHEKRIAMIKNEKEEQRLAEEQKIQGLVIQHKSYPRERDHEILMQYNVEEESYREKGPRSKENVM